MSLRTISPQQAKQLIDNGAVLIDIREEDEQQREQSRQAHLRRFCSLKPGNLDTASEWQVLFHCKSGDRTMSHAARLAAAAQCEAYVLEGGLEAWKRAGLPVRADSAQPLE